MLTITNDDFNNLFDNKKDVFFIQIGANDGVTVDPIQKLVKNNKWKGILFEPGIDAFNELKKNYAEVDDLIFVNSAVSNFDGIGKLFCGTTTPHFTLNQNKAIDMFDVTPKEVEVSIISPKSIIQNYNIKSLDLLQIDVEGHDFTILQAFPFDLVKPSIIRFEYINLSYDDANIDIVDSFLSKYGYDSFICYECGDIISIFKEKNQIEINNENVVLNDFKKIKEESNVNNIVNNKTNNIRVHRYENEMWGRAHLPFFKKFDAYLNKFFNVDIVNYNKDNNTFNGSIELQHSVATFGKTPPISDVDYVIENLNSGEVKVISFTEYFNSYISHIAKSDICSTVLLAHFNWSNVYHWMRREYAINHLHKIKPWIFLPFQEFDYKYYRTERNKIETYNDKLFWLGSGVDDYRKMIRIIDNKGYMQPIQNTSHTDYLDKLIKSKIGLSYYLDLNKYNTPYDHPGEFCYRDIEYIILGLPFIRIEFKDVTHNPLLPNHHYISIPREHAYVAYAKNGDEGVADLYIEKYNEVINDSSFLEYISKNQIKWANENLLDGNAEKLTFELLNLKEWLNDSNLEPINEIQYKEEYKEEFFPVTTPIILDDSKVRGHTVYKGFIAQQHDDYHIVMKEFIEQVRPARILEFGTAGGGFILAIRDILNEIGLSHVEIMSFEVIDQPFYSKLRDANINIIIENIFDYSYMNLEKPEKIVPYIQQEGITIVFCDGGFKIGEFNNITPYLKNGDFILAHDYADDLEVWEKNYVNKIWNWCEIKDSDIANVSNKYNLIKYKKDLFDTVAWTCRIKSTN